MGVGGVENKGKGWGVDGVENESKGCGSGLSGVRG